MITKRAKIIVFFAIVLTFLDGALKYLAITRFSGNENRLVSPIDFSLHKNPGIAFDIPIPLPIVFVITIFAIAGLVYLIWHHKHNQNVQIGSALIICGATGNLVDRLINGFTTDYLILFQTSAINIADILILSGVFLILWYNRKRDGNSN